MAFDIVIETAFFVVNDTVTNEYIRKPLSELRFEVDSSSVYRFYLKDDPDRNALGFNISNCIYSSTRV